MGKTSVIAAGSVKRKPDYLTRVVNILASAPLFEFKIVRFQDKTHCEKKYRFWLAFKIEDEAYCFLSTFTKKYNFLRNLYCDDDNAWKSVVHISKDEFNPPFNEDLTLLDCNIQDEKHRRTFSDLAKNRIDWRKGKGLEDCT